MSVAALPYTLLLLLGQFTAGCAAVLLGAADEVADDELHPGRSKLILSFDLSISSLMSSLLAHRPNQSM